MAFSPLSAEEVLLSPAGTLWDCSSRRSRMFSGLDDFTLTKCEGSPGPAESRENTKQLFPFIQPLLNFLSG